MDSRFPSSDKNKLHFQAGEGQICDVFRFTFECLCFATLTETQNLLPWPCSSHAARAGAAMGTLWHPGASFPPSIHLEGLRHSASLCADGSAGEAGDSGDSSCDPWLCPGLVCLCSSSWPLFRPWGNHFSGVSLDFTAAPVGSRQPATSLMSKGVLFILGAGVHGVQVVCVLALGILCSLCESLWRCPGSDLGLLFSPRCHPIVSAPSSSQPIQCLKAAKVQLSPHALAASTT